MPVLYSWKKKTVFRLSWILKSLYKNYTFNLTNRRIVNDSDPLGSVMDNILIQFCGLAEDMMNDLFVMNRDDNNKVSASWSTTILKHYIEGYIVIFYLLKKRLQFNKVFAQLCATQPFC